MGGNVKQFMIKIAKVNGYEWEQQTTEVRDYAPMLFMLLLMHQKFFGWDRTTVEGINKLQIFPEETVWKRMICSNKFRQHMVSNYFSYSS